MKNELNRFLLFTIGLSILACAATCYIDWRGLLFLPAIPFFCAQLLVCRLYHAWGPRLAPLGALLFWAGCGLLIAVCGKNWESILGLIMLCGSIGPAVSLVLGWIVHLLTRRRTAEDS